MNFKLRHYPAKTMLAVQKEMELAIARLDQLGKQIKPGNMPGTFRNDKLYRIIAPVMEAKRAVFEGAATAIGKENKDITPLRDALQSAIEEVENLGPGHSSVLQKLNRVKSNLDTVDKLRTDGKTSRNLPAPPNGLSMTAQEAALAAVNPQTINVPSGDGKYRITGSTTTRLPENLPNLGAGPARTV